MNSNVNDLTIDHDGEWILAHSDGLGGYTMDGYPVQSSSSNVSNQNDATSVTVISEPAQTTPDGQSEPSTDAPEPACPYMALLTTESFQQFIEEEVENSVVSLKSKLDEIDYDKTLDEERPLSTEFFKQLLIKEMEKCRVSATLKVNAEMDKIISDEQRPPATTAPQPTPLSYECLSPSTAKLFDELLAETVETYVVRRGSNVDDIDEKLPKDMQSMSITVGAISNENNAKSDPKNVIGESTENASDTNAEKIDGAVQSDVRNTTHAINVETNPESTATNMLDPVASECQTTENVQQYKQDCQYQYPLNTKKSQILGDLDENIKNIEKVGRFVDDILTEVLNTNDSLISKLNDIRYQIEDNFAAIGNDRSERCVIVNNLMREVNDIEKNVSHYQHPICEMSKELSGRMEKYVETLQHLWSNTIDSSEEVL